MDATGAYISTTSNGFTGTVNHPSLGRYEFTLTTPPVNLNNVALAVTIDNAAFPAGTPSFTFVNSTLIVFIIDINDTLIDKGFSIIVYDLT